MSSVSVGIGPTPVEVPPVVYALASRLWSGATVVPVWRNEYGGLTVRLEAGGACRSSYLKWVPDGAPCPDPLAEADRLVWAASFVPVPRVLDVGRGPHGSWLLTAAVEVRGTPATSAIEPRWRALAARSAMAVGAGLRRFHDGLPTDTCTFVRTAQTRVAALSAVPTGLPSTADRTTTAVAVDAPPPVDRAVVCHGDATVSNTLLDQAGQFAAHVDVGDLGVADRWSDIAVTTRSVTRRYGPGLEPLVLAAYGVAPDHERTTYYRALWDAEEAVRIRTRVTPVGEPTWRAGRRGR
ncbi:kanamycin kinase [Promicromonospora umidemergens]|uniref:Aminoglycoside 3'-phosphotransferase n=1 Tax=Promicromonospora umidemergens TaxID=629679 RepID=A0ABP8XSY1_9MICO|nr:phosphotransferase [Promicromonospora umidemergens]MCP2285233.1 kanamycin kinase [Promicromonospora umidemergens]